MPGESEPFQRFLNNEPFDLRAWFSDWAELVSDLGRHEVTVSRVRVITEPHTDYHRWLLSLAALNAEAGEAIRYLPRHLAGDVPSDDFWLLDDRRVAFTLSDRDGRSVGGVAVTMDTRIVDYCRGVRDHLWPQAIPLLEYERTISSR
nr:DUF6879 family protein [Nocardia jejuensis]